MTTHNGVSHLKVTFDIDSGDGTCEKESLWTTRVGDAYRLDNIPFYARGFAFGDVVSAAEEPDGVLRCTGLLVPSGHSTVRLWIERGDESVQRIRNDLREMGCSSELDLPRLVAVDVPPTVPYGLVKDYLQKGEEHSLFEYEEGCLAQEDRGGDEDQKEDRNEVAE